MPEEPDKLADEIEKIGVVAQHSSQVTIQNLYLGRAADAPTKIAEDMPDSGEIPACPYQGLSAFQEENAELFFGRDRCIGLLVQKVQAKPLVAVVGSSGSGKSSLVFAGLVPRLRKAGDWLITSFRPKNQPFDELAGALVLLLEPNLGKTDQVIKAAKLAKALQSGELSLQQVVSRIQEPRSPKLLLIADQFEELYTLSPERDRIPFIDVLLAGVKNNSGLKLVLTLRADFCEQAYKHEQFTNTLQDADLKLSAMNREDLRLAIECPAKLRQVELESGLVERILNDVDSGNLPLLEFALTQLWTKQQSRKLTHQIYTEIGGIKSALTNHANIVYKKLSKEESNQAKRVFLQLVNPGSESGSTRRQATRSEIPKDWNLVLKLSSAEARLLVIDTKYSGNKELEIVEIAHEALIREWNQLQDWINQNYQVILQKDAIEEDAHKWNQHNNHRDYLYKGKQLQNTIKFQREQDEILPLSNLANSFIKKGIQNKPKSLFKAFFDVLFFAGDAKSTLGCGCLLVFIALGFGASFAGFLSIWIGWNTVKTTQDSERNNAIGRLAKQGESFANENFSGQSLVGINWSSGDFRNTRFISTNLTESTFNETNLSYANFSRANLVKAKFESASLSWANFNSADLSEASFDAIVVSSDASGLPDTSKRTELKYANFDSTNLTRTNFSSADLRYAKFNAANLTDTIFNKTDLRNADFRSAYLKNTSFIEALYNQETKFPQNFDISTRRMYLIAPGSDLRKAKLIGADLRDVDLRGANLSGAILRKLSNNQTTFSRANLTGATLVETNLVDIDFSEVNFTRADLRNSDLRRAILQNSNFTHANLSGSNLRTDHLSSNFRNANLTNANLIGVDLTSSNLEGAILTGTLYDNQTKFPKGFYPSTRQMILIAPDKTLKGVNLRGADLSNTNLGGINLSNQDLSNASFEGSNLKNVSFSDTNLSNADFSDADLGSFDVGDINVMANRFRDATIFVGANLDGADFRRARNLTPEQVKVARNWQRGIYDNEFCKKLKLESCRTN